MDAVFNLIFTISDFLWGGHWNGTQIVPMSGPITYMI